MADLSAYLNFDIELNYVDDELIVRDVSNYPVGVREGITGIVSVTQPDGITITGDWNNPDVTWNGSDLSEGVKELRRNAVNKAQCGSYTVVYQVDHADYTPTTLSRTFVLDYSQVDIEVEDDFDVFTPVLQLEDVTDYSQASFEAPLVLRAWSVQVGTVGIVSGALAVLDLAITGNYYDAEYGVSLTTTLSYQHSTYSYLSVQDELSYTGEFTADTPPSLNDLVECLDGLKELVDEETCGCTLEKKYGKAERRLSHLIHKLRVGNTEDAYDLLTEFIDLTACDDAVNRNTVIQPYDLSIFISPGEGWLVYNYFAPSDITEFTIGALSSKIIKKVEMSGVGRKFQSGGDGDTPAPDSFIYVSVSGKFKYSDTIYEGTWIVIYYTNT